MQFSVSTTRIAYEKAKQTKDELNQIKEKIAKEENVKKDSTADNNNNYIDTGEPWLCVLGLQLEEGQLFETEEVWKKMNKLIR